MLFPEGRSAVTGSLTKVFVGAAMIADRSGATITAVRIEGPDRSPLSCLPTTHVRRSWFPKTKVTFLPARRLSVDPELTGRARRLAATGDASAVPLAVRSAGCGSVLRGIKRPPAG